MSMNVIISAPNLQLPWSSSHDEDRKLWRILGILAIPFLIISIAIPIINVPEPAREDLEKLPPQLARVVLEEKVLPKPTPRPTPPPKKEEKKKEKKKEEPKEKEKEKPKPKEQKPEEKPEPEPAKLVEKAREAAQAEINQFADALSELRDESFDLSDATNDLTQSTGEAETLDRSIISSQAKAGSGGIKTTNMSSNTGGVALSGKKSTQVKSKLKVGDGNATTVGGAGTPKEIGGRSQESMRKTMERNKGAIFSIYNRALRKDPALEGRVIVEMIIEPNGKISSVRIVSSDLNNPALEAKLLARIRLINFGALSVTKTPLRYIFDFLPN